MRQVILALQPQPEVLRQLLEAAGVGHGQQVTANLEGVRLERDQVGEKMSMYFCPMDKVTVLEKMNVSDGSEIPDIVSMPTSIPINGASYNGRYNLMNVRIVTNGSIKLEPTLETKFVLVKEEGM